MHRTYTEMHGIAIYLGWLHWWYAPVIASLIELSADFLGIAGGILITGGTGTGKSSIASAVAMRLQNDARVNASTFRLGNIGIVCGRNADYCGKKK